MEVRRPVVDVFNNGSGRCRTYRQHPQRARRRHLQLQWWSLPDLPPAPPGGPLSTSSTSVVATAKNSDSNPQGPAIDVSSFSGGRCQTCRQHLPRGPTIDVSSFGGGRYRKSRQHPPGGHRRCLPNLGTCRQNFFCDTYQGVTAVNITTISEATSRKSEG
jgi:hypothetical protein